MMPLGDQLEVFRRGAVDVLPESDLVEKLREGRPLRIKFGADPSAPDLHLGHTVPLSKLRALQDLGHQIVFLVGDFTGMIGDPSGKSETRRPLSRAEVQENAATYEEQVFRVLDRSRTEVRFNSEWMDAFTAGDMVRLCGHYTVARMLERDDFARRYGEQRPIGIHELLYPLIQGYDSVALAADVEVGGTDQRFNLLVGRELQRAYGVVPQAILTLPLLEGVDGFQKMSKSLGNAIGISEPPEEIYGKVMSISDVLMVRYYEVLTGEDMPTLREQLSSGILHPMVAKKRLANQLVARFYDSTAAATAEAAFERRFQKKERPQEVPKLSWPDPGRGVLSLPAAILHCRLASSSSEARRLIRQGAVRIDGRRVTSIGFSLEEARPTDEVLIQIGSRRAAVIIGAKKSQQEG